MNWGKNLRSGKYGVNPLTKCEPPGRTLTPEGICRMNHPATAELWAQIDLLKGIQNDKQSKPADILTAAGLIKQLLSLL